MVVVVVEAVVVLVAIVAILVAEVVAERVVAPLLGLDPVVAHPLQWDVAVAAGHLSPYSILDLPRSTRVWVIKIWIY